MTATYPQLNSESSTPLRIIVATRLRGLMGEERISQDQLAKQCGWGRGYVNRRFLGETPLDINDLETLQQRAGISMTYLLTGERPDPSKASNRDGGAGLPDPATYLRDRVHRRQRTLPLPCVDSNHKPFGYRPRFQMPCTSGVFGR